MKVTVVGGGPGGMYFAILAKKHLETPELPSVNIDFDWTYRKLLPVVWRELGKVWMPISDGFFDTSKGLVGGIINSVRTHCGDGGTFGRTWMTGSSALLVLLTLAGYLLSNFQSFFDR